MARDQTHRFGYKVLPVRQSHCGSISIPLGHFRWHRIAFVTQVFYTLKSVINELFVNFILIEVLLLSLVQFITA